jgi:hypothetical protein
LNKNKKCILLLLLLSGTLVFLIPNIAYANPGTTSTVDANPTAHTATGGLSVSAPGDAYDGNTATDASFKYDDVAGSFEVKTFTTPSSDTILIVDFKMNYEADAGGTGELYRILYYVGTSGPVVLLDWTGAAHAQATVTWAGQSEPNDGTWSWTDISNIRFVVEAAGVGGGKAAYFYEYESWVTVTTYSYTKGTISVNPASSTDPGSPFTVDIDIASVEDLYGWEFKLYYNNTILSNSSASEGTFLSSLGTTYFSVIDNTDTYNATHGRYWITCTLTGDVSGGAGSGTLATITFTVDGPSGTTPLAFADTKLIGYEYSNKVLFQMEHFTTDGSVTISGVPEFPLGLALEVSLVMVVAYIWWSGKRKPQKSYAKLAYN